MEHRGGGIEIDKIVGEEYMMDGEGRIEDLHVGSGGHGSMLTYFVSFSNASATIPVTFLR